MIAKHHALHVYHMINLHAQNALINYYYLKKVVLKNAQFMDFTTILNLRFAKNAKKVASSAYQKIDVIHVMNKMAISTKRKSVLKIHVIYLVKHA